MRILNAVSLNMLPATPKGDGHLYWRKITLDEARHLVQMAACPGLGGELISAVGHADTAAVFSAELGIEILPNRISVTLCDSFDLVGQYIGPRLIEGATTLPQGTRIEWFLVCAGEPVQKAADRRLQEINEQLYKELKEFREEKQRQDDIAAAHAPHHKWDGINLH